MNEKKKPVVLFIKEENSLFDTNIEAFDTLFESADIAIGTNEALTMVDRKKYTLIINDMTVDAMAGVKLLKHLIQMKPNIRKVGLMSAKDENRLGELMVIKINAYVLEPEQLPQALEAIVS